MQKLLNDLIVVSENDINTVDARKLHTFLESKQQFSNWIKNRIEEYDFIENIDYSKINKKNYLSKTGQTSTEYHISFDMAKELAMVEKNEKGRKARRYFIACEKELKNEIATLSPIELIIRQAQNLLRIEKEQQRAEKEQNRISKEVALIKAQQADIEEDYFSVKGYCSLMGERIDTIEASKIGRKCSTLSRQEGIKICKISDQRYGQINSYHKDILERIILSA